MDKKWRASKSSQEIVDKVASEDRYDWDYHDVDQLQRRLKQRHVQMCDCCTFSRIFTMLPLTRLRSLVQSELASLHQLHLCSLPYAYPGLFLGSGDALRVAGPLGALVAYTLVASVAYSSLCCIGEMTTWAPISGTFPHYAARWVDPALGFAIGWNYFYSNATSVPVEINAAVILLTFWDKDVNHAAIYTALIVILVCAINIFGVRYFGESEFFFSVTKLLIIIIILFAGLILDLGGGPSHERIGFKFWINPGAVNRAHLVNDLGADRFLAILSVVIQAAFSFQGMELVCIAASETESPRRNIAKAVRRVFYRIVVFYMLGILIIGMLVPYDNPALLSRVGTAAQSPFVIALSSAGVRGSVTLLRHIRILLAPKAFPHIVNAVIFTSAFSAASSTLFCSSRVLYGLSIRGQAPRFLSYTTKKGLPIAAVLASSAFALLSFMNISMGAETLTLIHARSSIGLSTSPQLVDSLGGLPLTSYSFSSAYRGMTAQGFDLKKNIYNNALQPYLAYWGMGWTVFFILMNGYAVFFKFNTSIFFTAYINIPIFAAMYFGYKILYRTRIWKPLEMDFVTGIPTVEETELPPDPPVTFLEKVGAALF
ncbi:General APC amino acid permease [Mycena indigotica]|uniref:General APC amino acid permease n=1 Tax=Mycena indigotica TaxID=2126181 RepID=A0A8H6T4U5_9AGAR|nr:General APC amino acid permease [Mycena indigotica]KAF7309445.1 General APC amino acid permease [Mycena indigotica]